MAKQHWRAGNMLYPVPPVMVSLGREGERPNIITVAWAGTVCSDPAMVSISVRPSRYSYGILQETGDFVINLVTKELARAADYCGVASGRDVDKFEKMGLTPLPSQHIQAVGIAESPVNIECRVKERIPLGTHDMFLAQVLGVTIEDAYLHPDNKFELNSAGLVSYSHGEYFVLGERLGSFGYSVKKNKNKKKKK